MRHINPLSVRMPPELKDRIGSAAAVAHRSINSELVARLESSFHSTLADVPTRPNPPFAVGFLLTTILGAK